MLNEYYNPHQRIHVSTMNLKLTIKFQDIGNCGKKTHKLNIYPRETLPEKEEV